MFVTKHIPVLFKAAALKLDDKEDRYAHVTCVLEPLYRPLASELGEEIAEHLYDSDADDAAPRAEISEVAFAIKPSLQYLTVTSHPEVKPLAGKLGGVGIERVKALKIEDPKGVRAPYLALQFVLIIPLETKTAREMVIERFGTLNHLTFQAMQGDLPLRGKDIVNAAIDGIAAQEASA